MRYARRMNLALVVLIAAVVAAVVVVTLGPVRDFSRDLHALRETTCYVAYVDARRLQFCTPDDSRCAFKRTPRGAVAPEYLSCWYSVRDPAVLFAGGVVDYYFWTSVYHLGRILLASILMVLVVVVVAYLLVEGLRLRHPLPVAMEPLLPQP